MKASAKRRRTKAEIKEQKRAEAQKKIEIENKLTEMEQLDYQVQVMKMKEKQVLSLDTEFQKLLDAGLLRIDALGNVNTVNTWEEHQQVLQQKEMEEK